MRELRARAPQAEPAMRESMLLRAKELAAELARREALFEAERARAAGEKLEAGTFVSFGAAPEVARFEDPLFGQIKVAIAEKINESARGTARNAELRSSVGSALALAKREARRELELPFHVFVEPPRGSEDHPVPGGAIYNAGAALSEEALDAYLERRSGDLVIVQREVPADELHPTLRQKFFFPRPVLGLIACAQPATGMLSELFVFQGRVRFKGFEATGGLGVWEMLDAGDPFFQLFSAWHWADWRRQAGLERRRS